MPSGGARAERPREKHLKKIYEKEETVIANKNKYELAKSILEYFWIKGWLTDEELERIDKRNKISFSV